MQPFLAKFAAQRRNSHPLPGPYSPDKSMWMIEVQGGPTPLAGAGARSAELLTKTEMQREEEDRPICASFATKTAEQGERDDEWQPNDQAPARLGDSNYSYLTPFNLRCATPRKPSTPLPGHYDSGDSVWTIDINGDSLPLLLASRAHLTDSSILALTTKTSFGAEEEDRPRLKELYTKTDAAGEKDE